MSNMTAKSRLKEGTMKFAVYYRRVERPDEKLICDVYETREEADARALRINCKPFTPYFAWVVEGPR